MEYMFKFDAWKDSNNDDVVVTAGSEDSTYFSFHNLKHWQLVGLSNQVTCRARGGEHKIMDAHLCFDLSIDEVSIQTLNSARDFWALIGCCYALVSTLPNTEIYVIIQVLLGT